MAQFTDLFAYSDGDIVSVSGGNWVKQSATGWSYPVASSVFSLDDGSCSWGDVQQVLANTLAGNITGDFEILAQVQITAPATFAVGVASLTGYSPGIDLGGIGMPGCTLYAGLDVMNVSLISGGMAQWPLAIPDDPSWYGLRVFWQWGVYEPGLNSLELSLSNAADTTVGC